MINNLIKQKREDNLNGTKKFQTSIYRMVFMAVVLVVFFFLTKQKYL
ncbi:hypothetical protein L1276_000171 [Flavobacterium sp. HSC-32F16]|nr:hypothetical protein [Flavobacterium sp. HSC-32F16]